MAVKAKKNADDSISQKLQLVMRSGKSVLGYKETLKALRTRKAKLVIVSSNFPPLIRSQLEYYAVIAHCGVHGYSGSNVQLGTACGKLFRVGCMAVTDEGSSDITKNL